MIDLVRTEEQLLAEIHAVARPGALETQPPRLVAEYRLIGRTPTDLLPLLTKTFSAFYAHLPATHVSQDLIDIVKKGVGNAFKWGNAKDQNKQLIVTAVMTPIGAVIKVGDEGNGFDVRRVIDEGSFTHGGSGLTRFHRTSSVITYADGGRTLLVRFLCSPETHGTVAAAGVPVAVTASSKHAIELTVLRPGHEVKVKGVLTGAGDFLAMKVTLKQAEDLAVIDAPLQHVQAGERLIRILNRNVTLPGDTAITDAELGTSTFDALRIGQVVELTERYVAEGDLSPVRIKIRGERNHHTSELQGKIDTIDYADTTFQVLGIRIVTDAQTKIHATAQALAT